MTERADNGTPIPGNIALLALDTGGVELARAIKAQLPGAEIHGLAGRVSGADTTFTGAAEHLRALFAAGRPIVGVCAAGILIRALAPLLTDKRNEPAVVAVSGDGEHVVPLLGGHGGANRLARVVAEITGGRAAVTTAGDARLGLALDDPPPGWRVANPDAAKGVMARLLAGAPVTLTIEAGDAGWIADSGAKFSAGSPVAVRITERTENDPGDDLVLHPPVLALGVGCERGTDGAELAALVDETLVMSGLAPGAIACVVSLDLKADEDAVLDLAERLGVAARFFTAAELEAEAPRLANPSEVVFREVGCHGVAEGAALAAVGPAGVLVREKRTSERATCAIAKAPADINPAAVGRSRGRLDIIGIGPGADGWRTPEATTALTAADVVVGYRLYLNLIADLIGGKARHSSELTEEEARVRLALDLAASGRRVALVSSGDAGIYALASLAFELLDVEGRADWNRTAVRVIPGVSAMQAAAARIGAPLGHDFCAISLSDLLTPESEIERRLRAAADGDFVVALYNPVSKRRRRAFQRAKEILLAARPSDTPVVLARNLGRDGETVTLVPLAELEPEMADMLTMVIIGNSRTKKIGAGAQARVYTPRGYEPRAEANTGTGSGR